MDKTLNAHKTRGHEFESTVAAVAPLSSGVARGGDGGGRPPPLRFRKRKKREKEREKEKDFFFFFIFFLPETNSLGKEWKKKKSRELVYAST